MKYITEGQYNAAILADELITAFGTAYGLSTAGQELTLYDVPDESDVVVVIEGHVARAPARELKRIEDSLTKALEDFYDLKAKERRYDSRYTCSLRAGYVGPFQAEGIAFATWMDSCNAYAYQVMSDVLAGDRDVPSAEELIAALPTLAWS